MDVPTSQSPSSAPSRRTEGGEERQSQQGGLGCVVRLRAGPAAVCGTELRVPGGNAAPGGAGAAGVGWSPARSEALVRTGKGEVTAEQGSFLAFVLVYFSCHLRFFKKETCQQPEVK